MRKFMPLKINKVLFSGNLTDEPIVNHTKTTSAKVVNFRLASSKTFKTSGGEKKEDVCYISVTAWTGLADYCEKNLAKGDKVLVEGELQSKQYEKDHIKRNIIEILAKNVQLLEKTVDE